VPGDSIAPRLAERLAQGPGGDLDVVVELSAPPAEGRDLASLREAFEECSLTVEQRIRELGGRVEAGAWINATLRARLPSGRVAELARDPKVQAVDLPSEL
jgi:hypothetical protein